MKNRTFLLIVLALGSATSVSADELDTLIHKLRGSTPPAPPRKVIESPSVTPQRHADLAKKLRGDTTPVEILKPAFVEPKCQTVITHVAAQHPPAARPPAPVTPPPAARPPAPVTPPPAARPPAPVTPPLTAHASKQRSDTSPLKAPDSSSVKKDIMLKAMPEKLEAEKSEIIFPAGSKSSRCADSRLKIVVPKAGTQFFPAGSRAFRLRDRTLKVVPPKPPTPAVQ